MNQHSYIHPRRHPKNVEGPFYSLAEQMSENGEIHSECLDCDIPQAEARELIKSLDGEDGDTYFIRQPITPEEISSAISATDVCCVNALRYGGSDPMIISRMDPALCDYEIKQNGEVCLKARNT